jgi:V/A-type H+-transporting ATPase subunit K
MKKRDKIIPLALLGVLSSVAPAWAQTAETVAGGGAGDAHRTIGLALAAGITMGLSVIGSGMAVGRIGAAAMGAAAEKPELLTRSLLFVALAEGLAVLGFAIAIMLVQKI